MLDTEFALALIDLCRRGHVVVAVDVLQGDPFRAVQDPLVQRMWALQRSAMYRDMGTVGVDVVAWETDRTLDQSMRAVPDRRRRQAGRRLEARPMRRGTQLVAHLLSTACGLLMVAAVGVGTHGPARVAAVSAAGRGDGRDHVSPRCHACGAAHRGGDRA